MIYLGDKITYSTREDQNIGRFSINLEGSGQGGSGASSSGLIYTWKEVFLGVRNGRTAMNLGVRGECRYGYAHVLLTYAVISFLRSLARKGARAYLPPMASNTLLVPSRLAFLQRSASGTVLRYALS